MECIRPCRSPAHALGRSAGASYGAPTAHVCGLATVPGDFAVPVVVSVPVCRGIAVLVVVRRIANLRIAGIATGVRVVAIVAAAREREGSGSGFRRGRAGSVTEIFLGVEAVQPCCNADLLEHVQTMHGRRGQPDRLRGSVRRVVEHVRGVARPRGFRRGCRYAEALEHESQRRRLGDLADHAKAPAGSAGSQVVRTFR